MLESSKYKTFFDIGIDDSFDERQFAQLRCYIYGDKKKKRVINNELVKKYFNNIQLTTEETIRLKKILDGSIYTERRNLYDHCKLCSDDFQREDLTKYSKNFEHWNLCIPTFPYFPGGLMVYLKDRKILRLENLQDIPEDFFDELVFLQDELFKRLKNIFGERLVGINILFNQLSKSELCIHGHVEPILRDIEQLNLGCEYVEYRPYDKFTEVLNKMLDDSDFVIKIPEGIKIMLDFTTIQTSQEILGTYEDILKYYFERGKNLQAGNLKIENDNDSLLASNMVPAATNFVYLTYYRNRHIISSVPELILDFVPIAQVSDDLGDLFSLSINRNFTNENDVFMRNYSPKIRPSIKIYAPNQSNESVRVLQRKIRRELER